MDRIRSNWKIALGFMLAALILYTVFLIIPIAQSTVYAFMKWDGIGEMKFIGFDGFVKAFQDEYIHLSLRNNMYILVSSVFVIIPLALVIAVVLNMGFKGYKFFRTVYFVPNILSTVVIALLWTFIYNPQFGLLNMILGLFGLESLQQLWLAEPKIAIFSVLVVNCWQHIGLSMIILLSGLKSIPDELYEAAKIDGASEFKKLFNITIPLLWETIKVTIILAVSGSMKAFDLVYVMTSGGPMHSTELLATYMYKKAFISFNYGYGSTISLIILLLSLLITFSTRKLMQKDIVQY